MLFSQRVAPIVGMADAMLRADRAFSQRVRQFEGRFGSVNPDMLGVLAQAAYFCWGNLEYRRGLAATCRAIGTGRPTSFYYHNQVTPSRRDEVNAYVVGVQRWPQVIRCTGRPAST